MDENINQEDLPKQTDIDSPQSLGDRVTLPAPDEHLGNVQVSPELLEGTASVTEKRLHESKTGDIKDFIKNTANDEDLTVENFKANGYDLDAWQGENEIQGYIRDFAKRSDRSSPYDKRANRVGRGNITPPKVFNPDEASPELLKLMGLLDKEMSSVNSVEESVKAKFNTMYDLAYLVASGRAQKRHLLIAGQPGVGKSYEVKMAITEGLKKRKNKLTYVETSGSVGRSLTNLLVYFYPKREKHFILLDDADDFLLSKDQLIRNFLKAMMDPDGHAISSPASYRNKANKLIVGEEEQLGEGSLIEIDQERLQENFLDLRVNGQQIALEELSEDDASLIKSVFKPLKEKSDRINSKKIFDKYGRRITESLEDMDDEEDDIDDEIYGVEDEVEEVDEEDMVGSTEPIPAKWFFNSSICIISNLYMDQIDEAVKSRTDKFEIMLNNDEFLCRLGSILPNIKQGIGSGLSESEWDWVKKECYALLAIAIEADKLGAPLDGKQFAINIVLQFRIIAELGDRFLTVADRYSIGTGEINKTKIANAIRTKFIKYHLIPALSGERSQ